MPHCKRNDGRKPAAAGSAEEAGPMGVIVDSVPNPTLSRVEELGPRVS